MEKIAPAILVLLVSTVSGQSVEVTPRESVRRLGDETKVLCKVAYSIDSCRMTVGTQSYRLKPGDQDGDVVYSGQGLQFGECGAHIRNIREEWNGNVTCVLPPESGSLEVMGTMKLIVAKAPQDPVLLSPPQPIFKEGDPFVAECRVANGRPAASITWALDEEPLLSGLHQFKVYPEPNTDMVTVAQNLTRTLQADDDGRRLECVSEHIALDGPKTAGRQLLVQYAPKRLESGPITIFGLKIGEEGRLNVTVRASPEPRIVWRVSNEQLRPGQSNNDDTITVLRAINLGKGYYNCTLVLNTVTKEDVERSYYLEVENDHGKEEFNIRMSTMDEPAGVELEAGAIVGIVIGVLVLIIAIVLIVFAKATDRWCFAANRRRDQVKGSGESAAAAGDVLLDSCPQTQQTAVSDTESAVGAAGTATTRARSTLAALGARVRAALPKHKDKVQAADQASGDDQKPISEEKKGIVYAELALGDQPTNPDKPPAPASEYAEILYTDQPDPAHPAHPAHTAPPAKDN